MALIKHASDYATLIGPTRLILYVYLVLSFICLGSIAPKDCSLSPNVLFILVHYLYATVNFLHLGKMPHPGVKVFFHQKTA